MTYTASAIVGNHLLSHFSMTVGLNRIIKLACLSSACFQIVLVLSRGLLSFALLRIFQVGFIAAVIPLTFSIFAREEGGKMIGFLNSSRFVGAAVGPLMATSVLAYSNLLTLYFLIAGLTLTILWGFTASVKEFH